MAAEGIAFFFLFFDLFLCPTEPFHLRDMRMYGIQRRKRAVIAIDFFKIMLCIDRYRQKCVLEFHKPR